MNSISLDAAVSLTTWSRRTWWRRLSDSDVVRVPDDSRGRAMLPWTAVLPRLALTLTSEDLDMIERADAGNASAQADLGQLLANAGRHEASLYWIRQAVEQNEPDAMQWLGRVYAAGEGLEKDENLALMWIAKAAAHGHVIAREQIRGLRR